jgi:transcriptional regulator with XRE-family HTH domain
MIPDAVRSGCPWSSALVRELSDDEFRHEYMMDQVRLYIAFQIRALREQRRWNQGDLAKAANKTQSVISRLEDPDYGKLSLQSCLEIAAAYDVPLLVQFVEWDDWLARMSNVSPSALRKRSFDANRLLEINRRMNESTVVATKASDDASASLQRRGLGATATASAATDDIGHSERPTLSARALKTSSAEGVPA